jgi:diguanylate cyclase (GGDEF)-like protein
MPKRTIIIIFISMIILGLLFGLVFHLFLMNISNDLLVDCIFMGGFIGIMNTLLALFLIKKYREAKTKNIKMNEELRTDKLTKLFNRRAFDYDIKSFKLNKEYSIIFFDIDNFRDFNNCFGHQVGDRVLAECSKIIKANIRQSDYAYRYGGDEIVVVLTHCNKRDATRVAQKTIREVRSLNVKQYPPLTLTAGVASLPEDANSFEELIGASDTALLEAKGKGKNQVGTFNRNEKRATFY